MNLFVSFFFIVIFSSFLDAEKYAILIEIPYKQYWFGDNQDCTPGSSDYTMKVLSSWT